MHKKGIGRPKMLKFICLLECDMLIKPVSIFMLPSDIEFDVVPSRKFISFYLTTEPNECHSAQFRWIYAVTHPLLYLPAFTCMFTYVMVNKDVDCKLCSEIFLFLLLLLLHSCDLLSIDFNTLHFLILNPSIDLSIRSWREVN